MEKTLTLQRVLKQHTVAEGRETWVWGSGHILLCVTVDKSLGHSDPQFPPLENGITQLLKTVGAQG